MSEAQQDPKVLTLHNAAEEAPQQAPQQAPQDPPPTAEEREEQQAQAYFSSEYTRRMKDAKAAAAVGITACDKLEALATLSGADPAIAKAARSYFRMAANKL